MVCRSYSLFWNTTVLVVLVEPHGQSPWHFFSRPRGGILSESLDSVSPRSGRMPSEVEAEPTARLSRAKWREGVVRVEGLGLAPW